MRKLKLRKEFEGTFKNIEREIIFIEFFIQVDCNLSDTNISETIDIN